MNVMSISMHDGKSIGAGRACVVCVWGGGVGGG